MINGNRGYDFLLKLCLYVFYGRKKTSGVRVMMPNYYLSWKLNGTVTHTFTGLLFCNPAVNWRSTTLSLTSS